MMLQRDLATIVQISGEDFLTKRAREREFIKKGKFEKMKDDPNLIPASCRIKLDLNVRKETSKS